ncbi:MAG: 5'-deoxynucleotidase [Lachnospiraceae bacterium]|nr:5'-deoxynucleotidase [Lachnospiraceae bacterium]
MENKNFFAMLSRMKYINRWGLMRNTINENIAEHSLDVAVIAHGLAVISNVYFDGDVDPERVAMLALFHDTTEIITGDMPTPIKYFAPEIKTAYKNVEKIAANQLLNELPEEMRPFYKDILLEEENEKKLWKFVKAADKISALIKCIEEKRMGNMDFMQAEKATLKAVRDMKMKEADYFLDNFLPAYSLTLDDTVIKG